MTDRLEGTIRENLGTNDTRELNCIAYRLSILKNINSLKHGFDSDVNLLTSNVRIKISVGHGLIKDAKIYIIE